MFWLLELVQSGQKAYINLNELNKTGLDNFE